MNTLEWYIVLTAITTAFFIGLLLGLGIAGTFDLKFSFSKKADYEEKIKVLESMLEQFSNEQHGETSSKFTGMDMFPPTLSPEFGLPRKLDKE